ncbi:uncharacterized protein LOC115598956 [Calypte anna]|uniref:uncharacterized protein LOC115598956 n=1 Tax=Calypte anna TaxID=9244 RepID=UPI0011C46A74|nr:uncharacterized protein LOC115598956 [Calypte anna]
MLPGLAEPSRTVPSGVESSGTESSRVETSRAEMNRTEPRRAGPAASISPGSPGTAGGLSHRSGPNRTGLAAQCPQAQVDYKLDVNQILCNADAVNEGEDSSHSSPAPGRSSCCRTQSSLNFFSVSPSHRPQLFTNSSSVSPFHPFHRVQSFRSRLLQHRIPMGSKVLQSNLLQHGLLSPWLHRSCQKPARAQASHRATTSFGHPPAPAWEPPWAAEGQPASPWSSSQAAGGSAGEPPLLLQGP